MDADLPDDPRWRAFFREHHPALCRAARCGTYNDADAKEAVQTACLELFHHHPDVVARDDAGVLAWLLKCVGSRMVDAYRRGKAWEKYAPAITDTLREQADATAEAEAPDRRAENAELAERIRQIVATMPKGCRIVFLLKHEGGLTPEEIATELGISRSSVYTQWERAVEKLRVGLADYQDFL